MLKGSRYWLKMSVLTLLLVIYVVKTFRYGNGDLIPSSSEEWKTLVAMSFVTFFFRLFPKEYYETEVPCPNCGDPHVLLMKSGVCSKCGDESLSNAIGFEYLRLIIVVILFAEVLLFFMYKLSLIGSIGTTIENISIAIKHGIEDYQPLKNEFRKH